MDNSIQGGIEYTTEFINQFSQNIVNEAIYRDDIGTNQTLWKFIKTNLEESHEAGKQGILSAFVLGGGASGINYINNRTPKTPVNTQSTPPKNPTPPLIPVNTEPRPTATITKEKGPYQTYLDNKGNIDNNFGNGIIKDSGYWANPYSDYLKSKTTRVINNREGFFEINNWDGYPNEFKPKGLFRNLEDHEYNEARKLANKTNSNLHMKNGFLDGFQIHEIHPVRFGGSPTDIKNKIILTRKEHAQYTTFWNKILQELKEKKNE